VGRIALHVPVKLVAGKQCCGDLELPL